MKTARHQNYNGLTHFGGSDVIIFETSLIYQIQEAEELQ